MFVSSSSCCVSSNLDPPANNSSELNLFPFPIKPDGHDPSRDESTMLVDDQANDETTVAVDGDAELLAKDLVAVTGKATSLLAIPNLPDSPIPSFDRAESNKDNESHAPKKPRLPSPNTQRILANADIAYDEATETIAAFNKRSIEQITKEGEGEEEMNLPCLFPNDGYIDPEI